MPEKRESLEDAEGAVPQGPRDMAKAGLPESQSPAVQPSHSLATASGTQRHQERIVSLSRSATSAWQSDEERLH